jgi:hypothetical protein
MIGAIIGIATTVATTAMSFAQANKQKQLQKQAEQEADKAMLAARKRLEVNYMDALSVQKEPYELMRKEMLIQGTQATQAAEESERGVAATAGRIQGLQNEAQEKIRSAMGDEMTEIERLKVAEDARLRDLNTQLDLGEVEGAQIAAANAQEMSAAAMEQGFAGVTSLATQAANQVDLYGKNNKINQTYNRTGEAGIVDTRNAVLNSSGAQLTSAGLNPKITNSNSMMQFNAPGTGMPTLNQNQQYPFMYTDLQSNPVNPFYPQIQLPTQ